MFQFTRPRGGATSRTCNLSANAAVSIHAPARGATQGGHQGRRVSGRFNSRAREGRDCCISGKIASARVSIHAPARGATALGRLPFVFRKFQFTRPRGARLREPRRVRFDLAFQFTRPRGARQFDGRPQGDGARFNSRAREGRDGGHFTPLLCTRSRGQSANRAVERGKADP